MSEKRKVIGATVGTPLSLSKIKEQTLPFVPLQITSKDGSAPCYILEIGKEYKIYAPKTEDGASFNCNLLLIEDDIENPLDTLRSPCDDILADSFTLKMIGWESGSNTFVYEYNGVLKSIPYSDQTPQYIQLCIVFGATTVLLYNPDAISGEGNGKDGLTPYIGDNGNWWIGETDTGVKAEGVDGIGISKIEKTATNEKIDTYTITYTNGNTFSYTVTNGTDGTNGRGISSIVKTTTNGRVDTYTITYTDKTTSTFTVTNGANGTSVTIASIGEVIDETTEEVIGHTVNFSDGKSLTVYNGTNGKDYVLTAPDKTEIAEQAVELINGVPDYVKSEAESVIDRVLSAQGNRTFTFAVMTDMHYGNGSYTDGIKHACQAMKYIDERVKLDTIAILGDYTDGYPASAYANAISDFKDINKILDTLRFGQNLRIQGNHDYYEAHKGEINRFIASYSEGVTWGDITGGYFYKDFDGYKIRVICVNTTEAGGGDIGVSTEQYNWFANSLDLSSKEDSTEWQILILSHHPLDWWSNSYVFAYILDAYKKGTTWSDGTITVDFTDKNSATLIGNIHGHVHNFLTDYIHLGNVNSGNKSDILRMATPNACYGRENQYTESVVGVSTWVEDTTYSKTQNTANDTAFCVYVVNLEACTITAICYGAGYDRKNVGYLSKAPIVNIIDTVGYTDTKRLSATSGEVRDGAENNFVTGYIELGNIGDVYRTSGVDFRQATNGYSCMCIYESNKDFSTAMTYFVNDSSIQGIDYTIDENGNLTLTLNSGFERSGGFIRLCGNGSGANLIVTKNQPIE